MIRSTRTTGASARRYTTPPFLPSSVPSCQCAQPNLDRNTTDITHSCACSSFALAIYSPSHDKVRDGLHTTRVLSLLPFTLYVYGLAFGPAIAAPLSKEFGRRFIYLMVTPVALLFILGAGLSHNIASLIICRLLAGLAIASPLAVGAGTILDIWTGINVTRGVILFMTLAFLGPALGSLIGGWIAEYKDWPWSQWTTLFLGASVRIFSLSAQETYAPVLMRQRARKQGLEVPPSAIPPGLVGLHHIVTVTLTRPLVMLVKEPIVLLCSLYSSLNFSVLFSFLTSIPLIYKHEYGFTSGQAGLVVIGIAGGCALGGMTLVLLDAHTLKQHVRRSKTDPSPPERMLWGAIVGGLLMPTALFWFAWTARSGIHWISISVLATGLFGFSNILIFVRHPLRVVSYGHALRPPYFPLVPGTELANGTGFNDAISHQRLRATIRSLSPGCQWVAAVFHRGFLPPVNYGE